MEGLRLLLLLLLLLGPAAARRPIPRGLAQARLPRWQRLIKAPSLGAPGLFQAELQSPAAKTKLPFPAAYEGDQRPLWASTFKYQGGPLITDPLNVVNIFYGNWNAEDDRCAPDVLKDLVNSISDDSTVLVEPRSVPSVYEWWKTVRKFTDSNKTHATNDVKVVGTWRMGIDPTLPRSLTYDDVETIIRTGLKRYTNTEQPPENTIYNVFLGETVAGEDACGEHRAALNREWPDHGIFYAIYQHPRRVLAGCGDLVGLVRVNDTLQGAINASSGRPFTANRCLAADALADTVLHELAESVTDPLVTLGSTAWMCTTIDPSTNYTANCENQDICSFDVINYHSLGGPSLSDWPKGTPEWVSFQVAQQDAETKGWFNLKGINGRKFYTAGALDPVTKTCKMSG